MGKKQKVLSSLLGGLLLFVGIMHLPTFLTQAAPPVPFVETVPNTKIVFGETPTSPPSLQWLTPVFSITETTDSVSMTLRIPDLPHKARLLYRRNATVNWQRIAMYEGGDEWVIFDVASGEYAVVKGTTPTLPGDAIVIDDLSAGFQKYGPNDWWHEATGPNPNVYYQTHAYWTWNTSDLSENRAEWHSPARLDGAYTVYAFVPGNYATTTNAIYNIYYTEQVMQQAVNQNIYYAEWVNLGGYTFTGAMPGYVELTDITHEVNTTHSVAFDAVAFVPQVSKIYLPIVVKEYTALPRQWQRTGIHMGNHMNNQDNTGNDWTLDMLIPFRPDQGIWPKIVVVQSDQVFSYTRTITGNCRIEGVHVRNENIYNYLSWAASEGDTWVVFRINPSKGNFEESILAPDLSNIPTRTLHSEVGYRPGNWDLCKNSWRFRPVDDIGDEILAIQRFTLWYAPMVGKPSWSAYGFEPANEPNIEWYRLGNNSTIPALDEPASWEDMDDYFSGVYDYVHANSGALPVVNVLTPPMSQHAYAEERNLGNVSNNCPDFAFSGYSTMDKVFNSSLPKNDGYSWHNYWPSGGERWEWGDCPTGHHLSMYFPSLMRENIDSGLRLGIITEADLSSPQMGYSSMISTKEMYTQTAESLRNFIQYEQRAQAIAVWLLHDNVEANAEHHWHQAYTSTTGFRNWFTAWWFEAEP